jgi:hypothetical protein
MKLPSHLKIHLIAAASTLTFAGPLAAQVIAIPNGAFNSAANVDAEISLLAGFNRQFGSGPWRVQGDGIDLPLTTIDLAAPSAAIDTTNASFGALLNGVNLVSGNLVSNSGRVYQNTLTTGGFTPTFLSGTTYILTADITTSSLLDLSILSNSGLGIGLLANSAGTASTMPGQGGLLSLSVPSGNTYTLSLTYTADSADNGQPIGVEGFIGRNATVALGALGTTSFDNFTLTAVPEPSALVMLGATGALGALRRRR